MELRVEHPMKFMDRQGNKIYVGVLSRYFGYGRLLRRNCRTCTQAKEYAEMVAARYKSMCAAAAARKVTEE